MGVTGIKFAFLMEGREISSEEFEKEHFRQLSPARAGRYITNMKYQVWDAFCEHGRAIERDQRIHKVELDEEHVEEFRFICHLGAYYLDLDQCRYVAYFILIPSNSCSIFAFYDVK